MKTTLFSKYPYRSIVRFAATILIVCGLCKHASSQVPTVTGFTPASGYTGLAGTTSVTINGTNFSTTPANNIVRFGTVKATVNTATATQLTVTAPAGASWQPLSVLVLPQGLTAFATGQNPFMPTVPVVSAITKSTYGKGLLIRNNDGYINPAFAAGDFDGDGKVDLVIPSQHTSGAINVYRNISTTSDLSNVTDAYQLLSLGLVVASGTIAYRIPIVADFNGDGKPDIAILSDGLLTIYRNTSTGINSFSFNWDVAQNMSPSGPGMSVASGDLDGDGKTDLLIGYGTSSLYLFKNSSVTNGTINFGAAPVVLTCNGGGDRKVALNDFDGDGKLDIGVLEHSSRMFSIFRNTLGAISTASFPSRADILLSYTSYNFSVGDLDGDGKQDVVFPFNNNKQVAIMRNVAVAGTITASSFESPQTFSDTTGLVSVAIADIDGDGKPDLVSTSTNSSLSIFRNTTSAGAFTTSSFDARVTIRAKAAMGAGQYGIPIILDVNRDGIPEILYNSTYDISIMTKGIFPVITDFTPATGPTFPTPTQVTINGEAFGATAADNIVRFGGALATVNSVSPTQLVVSAPSGAFWGPVTVTNPATGFSGGSYNSPNPFMPSFSGSTTIKPADYPSNVSFAIPSLNTSSFSMTTADFDGDGKPDMVIPNTSGFTLYRNISSAGSITSSSFDAPQSIASGATHIRFVAADIDGDGKLDLVSSGVNSNGYDRIYVWRNTSTGPGTITFATAIQLANEYGAPNNYNPAVMDFGIADIDLDGKNDIIAVCPSGGSSTFLGLLVIHRNLSTPGTLNASSFYRSPDPLASLSYDCRSMTLTDLDGDGRPDLIVGNAGSGSANNISVLRNLSSPGNPVFSGAGNFTNYGGEPRSIVGADVDGDGKPDIVVLNSGSTQSVSIFRNTSTNNISMAARVDITNFTDATLYKQLSIGDLNGDGKADIMVANVDGINLIQNASTPGTITLLPKVIVNNSIGSQLGLIVDVDGDGKVDVVSAQYTPSVMRVFRSLSSAAAKTPLFFQIP